MLLLSADISYVFCRVCFCIPIFKIFLYIIFVLIYCLAHQLKFLFLGLKKLFHFCFEVTFYFKINLKEEIEFSNNWKVSKRNCIDKLTFYLVQKLVSSIVEVIACHRAAICVLLSIVVLLKLTVLLL